MKQMILEATMLTDMEAVHDIFARTLSLPETYGRNLDALYDCLTAMGEPVEIVVPSEELLTERLGRRGAALLRMLWDVSRENAQIMLKTE